PTTADRSRPQPGPQPTAADHSRVHSRPQPGPQPTKVMTIDKSWTTISNRNSEEFLDGLFAFIKHCKPLLHPITQKIHCPCSRCCNRDDNRVTLEILEVHISRYGFDQHYTTWKYHGEPILPLPPPVPHSPEHVDMDTFFEDISANNVPTPPTQTTGPQPSQTTGPNNEFEELLSRSTQKLYPGCDMSTLEFTTEISHIKALHKITDAGFNKILALLQKACPPSKGYNFPSSYYEIKKTYKKIGLGYESIHACINDCFLFWGSEENLKMPNCPVCKESRYKKKTKAGKLVAKKIVRYFPLTPRLQRMFNTKHIAKWMTWHATGQSKEKGKMNHPCDGRAWKYFDMMKPEFSGDARNVRLGLAADGFNPFGMMSQTYSMWPVILTTYNTPPWMCMKETSLMLTMLIPGPKSPAKDIDVYLQPLIKELQELWKGVWTKDAATGTHFQMKAALLWTINDFPARSSLSGWSGQGYYACPTCNVDTPSMAVKNKIAYVGHRRFLRTRHPQRSKFKEYYGSKEPTPKPRKFSELEIQLQISKVLKRRPGKHPDIAKKNPKPNREIELNWSKRSIFWDLEYWPFLKLKHNLDVMHIEKNALEALLNTLLQNDKTKDTVKARQDLETLKVRKELWLVKKTKREVGEASSKDDVETRFNRLGRNDDGLPEEEPNKFQVFRSACKLTGRMKATRLTTDVRQAVVWFVLNNSPEVDADILAYREKSPDNVETNFPAWFNHKIREKNVNDGCSEELFSLACGPISTCTYPACIVNGVKFVVHERDIFHTTQCSGVSTLGLDGEMYYGQLEEILELTYIGNRKVVLFRCKWFDTINPKNLTTRNRRSYIEHGIQHILTDREFHKNNQYILATQVTQVFYLEDLARQPRGWKVVEHVYHRDVAESDQDVIHGSSSSNVTLSVELTNFEHTDLSINSESTEVDASPVNDDNANANEGNAEDDVYAHVLDDDDDVVVSDDDEVNPSTNVEEMACVFPRSHGGDAGGSPPRRPNRPVPAQCESSNLRIETGNASLRRAFRQNGQRPLTIGFDYGDLGTFHPTGDYSSMLNSLMGETVKYLPLACEWEEIPEAYKAHIFPTLEKVEKGHYEDLIETWRKGHSSKKTGEFKTEQNKQGYLDMKGMQDRIKAGLIPFKTDQEILDEVVPSDNRQNMSGMGRKLPGGGLTSRRRANRAYGDVMTRDHMTQILRQQEQEKELYRKQAKEGQARAYLASLKADTADQRANVAYQNTESIYGP
ncbi:CACTA transposable element, partial [Tanacetum coccineum]